ncbi:MAG: class I SAM-dependent methyltransferase [Candidatus Sumerlaeota bacterium]|nr:class I SAM-dependent methyltransferase [Candidatus Sumerlaeota bacterium]
MTHPAADEHPVNREAMARYFNDALRAGLFLDFDPDERKGVDRILELCGVRPGAWLFEPGCGAGRFTRLLAPRVGPEGRIDACEVAPAMVRACRRRVHFAWVRFHQAMALELSLPESSYDAALCLNLWPHLDHVEAHLKMFASMLKPDGRLIVAHSLSRESVNAIHGFVAPSGVRAHALPAAGSLAGELEKSGWRPETAIDEEIYFVSARPPAAK